jgi:peptidoglycan hydrolase CwlO-like protein
MAKVKQNWKEQLKKLNNKKQERDDAVVSLKNKTAKKNKEKAVKLKFLNDQTRDNKRRQNNAERLANVILDYVLNHKPYMYNG